MSLPEPFRGEVWDVDFDDFGLHPAVVFSINALNTRLGHVAVIPVTGTRGPDQTHVPLHPDAGLKRYPESFADVTGLQPVARSRLLERRGPLAAPELDHLARTTDDLPRTRLLSKRSIPIADLQRAVDTAEPRATRKPTSSIR